jgi:1-acyl-sn-glycerol-3-phosphate acyltransferase
VAIELTTRRSPHEQDPWWVVATTAVGALAAATFRMRVSGLAHVPSHGGALLAYNHLSVLDAIFVGLPVSRTGRVVRFFALSEDFERPLLGPALKRLRSIPIRRGVGDWAALDQLSDVVRRGWLGGIAPEGTIGPGPDMLPVQKGAARIALLAGAPVVPIGIWGTQERWPKDGPRMRRPIRPSLGVSFGPPIVAEGDPKHRPDVQALTDRIGRGIGEQVASARRLALNGRR